MARLLLVACLAVLGLVCADVIDMGPASPLRGASPAAGAQIQSVYESHKGNTYKFDVRHLNHHNNHEEPVADVDDAADVDDVDGPTPVEKPDAKANFVVNHREETTIPAYTNEFVNHLAALNQASIPEEFKDHHNPFGVDKKHRHEDEHIQKHSKTYSDAALPDGYRSEKTEAVGDADADGYGITAHVYRAEKNGDVDPATGEEVTVVVFTEAFAPADKAEANALHYMWFKHENADASKRSWKDATGEDADTTDADDASSGIKGFTQDSFASSSLAVVTGKRTDFANAYIDANKDDAEFTHTYETLFNEGYYVFIKDIIGAIYKDAHAHGRSKEVIFTGHGYGGALAQLAKVHWSAHADEFEGIAAKAITFGSPGVGCIFGYRYPDLDDVDYYNDIVNMVDMFDFYAVAGHHFETMCSFSALTKARADFDQVQENCGGLIGYGGYVWGDADAVEKGADLFKDAVTLSEKRDICLYYTHSFTHYQHIFAVEGSEFTSGDDFAQCTKAKGDVEIECPDYSKWYAAEGAAAIGIIVGAIFGGLFVLTILIGIVRYVCCRRSFWCACCFTCFPCCRNCCNPNKGDNLMGGAARSVANRRR